MRSGHRRCPGRGGGRCGAGRRGEGAGGWSGGHSPRVKVRRLMSMVLWATSPGCSAPGNRLPTPGLDAPVCAPGRCGRTAGMASQGLEVEKKYDVGNDAIVPALQNLAGVARMGEPHTAQLEAVYFDT